MTSRKVEANFNSRTKNDRLFVGSICFLLNVLQLVRGGEQEGRETTKSLEDRQEGRRTIKGR